MNSQLKGAAEEGIEEEEMTARILGVKTDRTLVVKWMLPNSN